MKSLLLSMLLVMFISCGRTLYVAEKVAQQEKVLDFSGYYHLSAPDENLYNCLRLTHKTATTIDVESECQSFTTINPENKTIGQFPTISQSNTVLVGDEIVFTRNLNYTSGNDLEQDVSGANITGSRRTDVRIFKVDGRLKVVLSVYGNANNNNLNSIVATREFTEK